MEARPGDAAVDFRAAVEEQQDHLEMPAVRRGGERRAAFVGGVHVRAAIEQELHGPAVSGPCRGGQQRNTLHGHRAYVGAVRQQELHHRFAVGRAHSRGVVQRRQPARGFARVDVRAGGNQDACDLEPLVQIGLDSQA